MSGCHGAQYVVLPPRPPSAATTQSDPPAPTCRDFLERLAGIVGANMAELSNQRAASVAAGSGKAAVYELERALSQLEAGTVLEPYAGEDLKEIHKAAEVGLMDWVHRTSSGCCGRLSF